MSSLERSLSAIKKSNGNALTAAMFIAAKKRPKNAPLAANLRRGMNHGVRTGKTCYFLSENAMAKATTPIIILATPYQSAEQLQKLSGRSAAIPIRMSNIETIFKAVFDIIFLSCLLKHLFKLKVKSRRLGAAKGWRGQGQKFRSKA